MAFSTTITTAGDTATITLSGELDASSAPQFKAEVEQAASQGAKKLVLMMQDLEYMASAGLRVLIFAKQKMGADTDIYLVGTQELVKETIEKTGFDQSVYMVDTYDD
ncbi:STAS domain-containing protein [Trichothermofontia sichuanensis B231]|uniref:STAS domain-containing protein n=1 Tax=Trichothermofontia sichuanensis TaxID=3045816 RepID=UPI002245CF68|nr:STAS domain-containing protein [Trichothermofontia sichuanensis]UZQ52881.1 STAS domain-containing protein [Trichothermofontia sichuanensis B231]